jgi:hypothetical protein
MAKRSLKNSAARARAARAVACLTSQVSYLDTQPPILLKSDSDSDVGYEGGVDCTWSDSDYEPGTDSGSDWCDSDADSLSEFEGEGLEANLQELREELEALGAPVEYHGIRAPRSAKEWKKIEGNRALGYTGHSQRTQQRKAKEAREQTAMREEARESSV